MNNEDRTMLNAYKALAEKLQDENSRFRNMLRLLSSQDNPRAQLIFKGVGRWCHAKVGGISHAYLSESPEYLVKEKLGGVEFVYDYVDDWAVVDVVKDEK